ncbi:GntR family transcriptional regulator [Brevibacterium sp. 50QC2O2]|uniref:GntR family transcriptional regulator n=1 Tax=Brevibacterium sp. 50QC2O2 TaxID=2968459 RepID=UPI00211C89DB|nr:GntR family transcriptional regulator [Brevibacterium sp. 50QC2O2]MCQ9389881.1 GntR family transcriptional regulator [Brevibacterium sp. 50QC2O2]
MVTSKHAQIRSWIEDEIAAGRFVPGDKLPSEKALMEQFGVSRTPVQTAMTGLVEAGVVTRRSGFGTVVGGAPRPNLLRHIEGPLRQAVVEGDHVIVSVRVSTAQSFPLSSGVLADHAPIAEIIRKKLSADGRPMAVERCVADLSWAPGLLDQDLTHITTIAYYTSVGINVDHAASVLSATLAGDADAELLDVSAQTPIIRQKRTTYVEPDKPLEVTEMLFHPTNVSLTVTQLEAR